MTSSYNFAHPAVTEAAIPNEVPALSPDFIEGALNNGEATKALPDEVLIFRHHGMVPHGI